MSEPNPNSITSAQHKLAGCYALNLYDSGSCHVCAEEDRFINGEQSRRVVWSSYEADLVSALERVAAESFKHPLPVKLYPAAKRELRNALLITQFASKLDKLSNLLSDDVRISELTGIVQLSLKDDK